MRPHSAGSSTVAEARPTWGGVAGQRDRVPGDLTGVADAEPLAHQHPGLVQAGEELLLAARGRGSGGDLPPQRDPGCFVQAAAGGLLVLRAGRAAGRGAVGGRGGAQPVPLLGGQAGGADLVPFPGQAGLAAVLAGQHRDQMDVVIAVPDGDPADGLVFLTVGRQPGAVHDLVRDGGPLVVGRASGRSGAARIEQCHTGRGQPRLPRAAGTAIAASEPKAGGWNNPNPASWSGTPRPTAPWSGNRALPRHDQARRAVDRLELQKRRITTVASATFS